MAGEQEELEQAKRILGCLNWDDESQPKSRSIFSFDDDEGYESDNEVLAEARRAGHGQCLDMEESNPSTTTETEEEQIDSHDEVALDSELNLIFSEIAQRKAELTIAEKGQVDVPPPSRDVVRGTISGVTFELSYEQLQKWNEHAREDNPTAND